MDQLIKKARAVAKKKMLSDMCQVGSVGCALVTAKGNIYVGACLDAKCGLGFCAEVNAIGEMTTRGEGHIKAIVAVKHDGTLIPPCGKCRELMYQVSLKNLEAKVVLPGGAVKLKDLLPVPWYSSYGSGKKTVKRVPGRRRKAV